MVDKAKRMVAAKVIGDFLSCRITNFEYSHRYPRSDDLVILLSTQCFGLPALTRLSTGWMECTR
jgi:hypothetical protein